MDIPKQLMIGSVPYDVEVVKGWLEERENGEVRIAEVTYHEQQIKISDNVAKHEGQMKNVLHEAIHAMLYEYGLDRLNKEANVNALTTVFFDFIKNNIRGGISSFVGHQYLVLTSPEKQVAKEEQHGFSFINTAGELVDVVNQHPPEVDVSALGAAMAKAEVHKTVDLGVTHEQIQESAVKMVTDKQTRKLPIVEVNRSSFPMEEIAKITKKKRRIKLIGKQVLSMMTKVNRDIVHAMSAACVGIAGINMSIKRINLQNAITVTRNSR